MKHLLVAILAFGCPSRIAVFLLRLIGFHIGKNVRIGFSFIWVDRLFLGDGCRIGHLNFIRVRRLLCDELVVVARQNIMNGPISVRFFRSASVGNRNKILRPPSPRVVNWGGQLRLGVGARITSDHSIDCTRSVFVGEYSILAGSGSQLWTHGYVHSQQGPGRYRIDGKIRLGNNVNIGSRCIVTQGVTIVSGCSVGAGTVISKSLAVPGLYVGAAVRCLPLPADPLARMDLRAEVSNSLCESVYLKQ